jgi:hypothetical protein
LEKLKAESKNFCPKPVVKRTPAFGKYLFKSTNEIHCTNNKSKYAGQVVGTIRQLSFNTKNKRGSLSLKWRNRTTRKVKFTSCSYKTMTLDGTITAVLHHKGSTISGTSFVDYGVMDCGTFWAK